MARDYKTFFVLNSAEHEISNAHKYKSIKKFNIPQTQINLECFFPAHKCQNANNCWHFNINEQEQISYSVELSMKRFITSGRADLWGVKQDD